MVKLTHKTSHHILAPFPVLYSFSQVLLTSFKEPSGARSDGDLSAFLEKEGENLRRSSRKGRLSGEPPWSLIQVGRGFPKGGERQGKVDREWKPHLKHSFTNVARGCKGNTVLART